MKPFLLLLALAVVLSFAMARAANAKASPGEPVPLSSTRSIGDVIADAQGRPVHIVYVHGMRAEGPGAVKPFVERLGREIGHSGSLDRTQRRRVELGAWPSTATVGSSLIWRSEAAWNASAPFVDRYVLKGAGGETVILDEVNWWPLLFPLKCHFLLLPERIVSGADKAHLRLCARRDDPYYPWISETDLVEALSSRPLSGGAARINRALKREIMNWGLSDAVITLGPMRMYVRESLNQAFSLAAQQQHGLAEPEYIVISESLGSFAVLDAFESNEPSVKAVLDRTHNLYFLANQFALLDLGRVEGLPSAISSGGMLAPAAPPPDGAPALSGLKRWATGDGLAIASGTLRQVIAFSDPSDVLTYRVPDIEGATVSNVYVRNTPRWFGLFADPAKAHAGHVANPRVMRIMLDKRSN
jgi:hypothetical protein